MYNISSNKYMIVNIITTFKKRSYVFLYILGHSNDASTTSENDINLESGNII